MGKLASFLNEKGIQLIAQSFIHFEPVPFSVRESFDVIFFSSPRSFLFYKLLNDIPKNVLIACPGNKTAKLINELGFTVSFFGDKSGNIQSMAKEFKEWCGDKRILFPSSNRSLQTVSSLFPESQKEIVIVYNTKIVSKPLEYCDIYVFTSPSNAEGFLTVNEVPEHASVYSWGESTTAYLNEKNIHVTSTLENSSIEDLIALLSK